VDLKDRLRLEEYYVRSRSLWLDYQGRKNGWKNAEFSAGIFLEMHIF
jgi:hypothetical protein